MVSSKDVAKFAGVSQSTVSRVLNTPETVKKNTRDKVLNAMREMNYRPNSVARSLVNKRTKAIALLSGPLHNPFFTDTTTSIVNYAKDKGYNVNVHFENFSDNMEVYQDVFKNKVDGIILSTILFDDPIYEQLNSLNIPFVMFNRKHKDKGHFVEMDNVQAGRLATEHLIDLNHRNIVWVGGPQNMTTFSGRYQGFEQVMIEHNLPYGNQNIVITDTSKKEIFRVIESIMSRKDRPTAIFASTDSIAIFILDYLIQKGYQIPDDISVIGVDNVDISSHHSFQLSTIGVKTQQNIGRIAIEDLINLIEDENPSQGNYIQRTFETKLIVRRTTDIPFMK
jgi:DNA-binding LacI/PurR family transcriptional regulator